MANLDKRVQLLLPEAEWKQLSYLAQQQNQSVGHLIREAIAQVYHVGERAAETSARSAILDKWSRMSLAVDEWDVMEDEVMARYDSSE
ncbi:MAG: hypothetical protein R2911_18805 [Caldilineaceae bacterium]